MKYLYKQTGIVVESDNVLDSTMFKPIIEEKIEDLIEDSETETGVAEAENTAGVITSIGSFSSFSSGSANAISCSPEIVNNTSCVIHVIQSVCY